MPKTFSHKAMQTGVGVGAVVLFLLGAAPAPAATYRFTTVLDSQRDGLTATRCAAINTLGTVAVQVEDDALGINKLVTKRGANDAPVVVAHTERVANYPTFCDNGISQITSNPSINELGEVAFQGNLRRLSSARRMRNAPAAGGQQARGLPRQGRAAHDDRAHQEPAGQRLHFGVRRRRHVGEQLRPGGDVRRAARSAF